jgi:hypothetical protein
MNIQAKVARDKEKHPERFCKHARCLWRVLICDRMTREMVSAPNCKAGYCPRHAPRTVSPSVLTGTTQASTLSAH